MYGRLKLKRFCRPHSFVTLVLLLPLLAQVIACSLPGIGEVNTNDSSATITAMQATINAVAVTATPQPTSPPSPTPLPPTQPPPTQELPTLPPPPAISPQAPANLEEIILSSRVLLYEDVAGNPEVFRYVAAAMERLGFRKGSYVDLGDAQGRLMDRMIGNAPDGQPWDLIIIAAEDRTGIQGTFFEILEGILNAGKTSVILEAWYLDEVHLGTAKPILLRCGVDVANWFGGSRTPADLKIYAYQPDHPLLNEVVSVRAFRIADYWPYEDQGDLMFLTGTGDAQLVLGTRPDEPNGYGVLAECYNSRLILQTMSTHNYLDETMVSLWANYIHYALRKHHGY